MKLFYIWLSYLIIGTIILIGKAISCRLLGIHHRHYQIGFSPNFIELKLFKVRFSIGIVIPFPWLFKIYEIRDNKKRPLSLIWMRRELSTWKRITVIMGGMMFLYVFSLLFYSINFHKTKNTYLSIDDVNKNGIYVDSIGEQLGFQSGDKIVKVNGHSSDKFSDLMIKLYSNEIENLIVKRNDSLVEIEPDQEILLKSKVFYKNQIIYPVVAKYPLKIDSVLPGRSAFNSGLITGDKIISVNGDTVFYFRDFQKALKQNSKESILLGINRENQNELKSIIVSTDYYGRIGVIIEQSLTYTSEDKTLFQSLNSGNVFIQNYYKQFKRLYTSEPEVRYYGGFVGIGNLFPRKNEIWRIISTIMMIYLCWSWIPSPITEGRYMLVLLIDKLIQLPKNAPAWISWGLLIFMIVAQNFSDLMKFL